MMKETGNANPFNDVLEEKNEAAENIYELNIDYQEEGNDLDQAPQSENIFEEERNQSFFP